MSEPIRFPTFSLKLDRLCLNRGGKRLAGPLDLEVGAGVLLRIIGPNGSGKSTLLRTIAGLREPHEGRVSWGGTDLIPDISWLGHLDGLTPALTIRENLEFRAQISGHKPALDILARLGIADLVDRPARRLSAGQRRRAALAAVISASAPVWLLDEPLTAMDVQARGLAETVIADHLKAGGLVVAATHGGLELPEAIELCLGALP